MSVVDSSGWIEFLSDGPNASRFAPELSRAGDLVIPTIVACEVARWLHANGRGHEATETVRSMSFGQIVPLSMRLAETAADLGIRLRLPLADSIIYATAQSLGMDVWTQDRDFGGLPGVVYVPKLTA